MPQPKPRPKRKRPRRVKRVLNIVPSQDTERDWRIENADQAGLLAAAATVPKTKDLREDWWKVGDQKETGSCVGWATADSLLRWHFVKGGRIKNTDLLSKRFIWMASKETDEYNTSPRMALPLTNTWATYTVNWADLMTPSGPRAATPESIVIIKLEYQGVGDFSVSLDNVHFVAP